MFESVLLVPAAIGGLVTLLASLAGVAKGIADVRDEVGRLRRRQEVPPFLVGYLGRGPGGKASKVIGGLYESLNAARPFVELAVQRAVRRLATIGALAAIALGVVAALTFVLVKNLIVASAPVLLIALGAYSGFRGRLRAMTSVELTDPLLNRRMFELGALDSTLEIARERALREPVGWFRRLVMYPGSTASYHEAALVEAFREHEAVLRALEAHFMKRHLDESREGLYEVLGDYCREILLESLCAAIRVGDLKSKPTDQLSLHSWRKTNADVLHSVFNSCGLGQVLLTGTRATLETDLVSLHSANGGKGAVSEWLCSNFPSIS